MKQIEQQTIEVEIQQLKAMAKILQRDSTVMAQSIRDLVETQKAMTQDIITIENRIKQVQETVN